ncbi:MAG: N-acetylmuramoyl-L-alanine amidase [Spirochaetes bacterium]|uniref:N-acetylmuramoyl-L-alanine amidase n=1 Tax=Candidatus Gallitreponema excrementavium TaxID=2840840 RepID=A0A9D9HN21_9SPIR|nr:N-acetylmuramoyl-L-alanine amidase [Candidatus Gallitreponema excrementavium]
MAGFSVNADYFLFDDGSAQLISPPYIGEGGLFFQDNALKILESYFSVPDNIPHFKIGAILIDPGHGGKDPGAVGEYTLNGKKYRCVEKDVVLDCSTKIYRKLKEKYPDKAIMMTRTGDTYPSLEDRVEMANNISLKQDEAIIYVSVHANSSFSKTAKGYEVWYLSQDYRRNLVDESDIETKEILPILNNMMEEEFTMESILIAKFILDGLTEQVGDLSPSRGLKEENWFVVRNARMPSVLIELGFVSNEEEGRLLNSEDYLQKCADGIYNGVVKFIDYFEHSRGFTSIE